MLSIESILTYIHKGISNQDPRFLVEDFEHIIDTQTGVIYHVYDNWFKVTHEDENVITKDDFTKEEQTKIWEIKQLITPPDVLQKMETDYKPLQEARREKFSYLYENPTPVATNAPVAEVGAASYTG